MNLHHFLYHAELKLRINGYTALSIIGAYVLSAIVGTEQIIKFLQWLF